MSVEVATTTVEWPIWGHRQAVATLSGAIAGNRVRHAYLFGGPEGVGKGLLASTFAKALACLEPPAPGAFCDACRSCRKVDRGVHPDVQRYDLESQAAAGSKTGGKNTTLTIDTIRALSAGASLRPVESDWRVIIVDDAELMQETAQEALLKTLEDPPPYAVVVLLASDAELLLPTVRSRCQAIELSLLPRATIEESLLERGVAGERAAAIAGVAAGAPGWALRACADPPILSDRVETLARTQSWITGSPFERIVVAFRLGDSFSKRRAAVFRELEMALGVWRDLLLVKTGNASVTTFPGVARDLAGLSECWSLAAIHGSLRSVRQCIADLEANVRPRLAIEAMVLQWPTATATAQTD
jgi:DNA polymerase-3 subunit delta'